MRPSAHGAFAFRFACRSIPETPPFPLPTPNSHPPTPPYFSQRGCFSSTLGVKSSIIHALKQGVAFARRGLREVCLLFLTLLGLT